MTEKMTTAELTDKAAEFELAMKTVDETLHANDQKLHEMRQAIMAMTEGSGTPMPHRHDDEKFLELCRAEFSDDQVGKLPRTSCGKCGDKNNRAGTCDQHPRKARCEVCKQWITPAHVHIDFVGHADLTDRLLSIDPMWDWDALAWHPSGVPYYEVVNNMAVMWITLTIDGRTRKGVGTAPASQKELHKELIGDALRNAAMRFGIALYLWSKSDKLESQMEEPEEQQAPAQNQAPQNAPSQRPQGNPAPNTAPTPPEAAQGATSTAHDGSAGVDLVGMFSALSNKATKEAADQLRGEGMWPVSEIGPGEPTALAMSIMQGAAELHPA